MAQAIRAVLENYSNFGHVTGLMGHGFHTGPLVIPSVSGHSFQCSKQPTLDLSVTGNELVV